jgi:hypothetical protein
MPFDGSGNFSRLFSWVSDRDNGIRILAQRMDAEFDNFAGGMNAVFFRNGLVPMSGNLNMGSNSIIGMAAGTVNSPSLRFADDPNTGAFLNGVGNYAVAVNGTVRQNTNAAGVAITGTHTVSGNAAVGGTFGVTAGATFASTVSVAGALTQNGNQVWHAGNLNPVAQNTTPTLTGAILSGAGATLSFRDQTLPVDPVHGWQAYSNGDTLRFYQNTVGQDRFTVTASGAGSFSSDLSAAGTIRQAGNAVWHAGNFNPGNYAALNSAPTFSGRISRDAYLYMDVPVAGIADMSFDTGDVLRYDRTNNRWDFLIDSATRAYITSTGLSVPGALTVSGNAGFGGTMTVSGNAGFGGSVGFAGVSGFSASKDGNNNPIFNMTPNTVFGYNVSGGYMDWIIGGTSRLRLFSGDLTSDVNINAPAVIVKPGAPAALNIGDRISGNSWIVYSSGDRLRFFINGQDVFTVDTGGNLRARGNVTGNLGSGI